MTSTVYVVTADQSNFNGFPYSNLGNASTKAAEAAAETGVDHYVLEVTYTPVLKSTVTTTVSTEAM